MQKLLSRTNTVIDKAKKLSSQYGKLQQQYQDLENELKKVQSLLGSEQLKNVELNNKIKIIKLAQNIGSERPENDPEITELKRKVNEYIREIDTCIAMLNE